MAQESRENEKVEQENMDQVLCLGRTDNNCSSEIKTNENKYPSDAELFSLCRSIRLSNYKIIYREYMSNMAGFKILTTIKLIFVFSCKVSNKFSSLFMLVFMFITKEIENILSFKTLPTRSQSKIKIECQVNVSCTEVLGVLA